MPPRWAFIMLEQLYHIPFLLLFPVSLPGIQKPTPQTAAVMLLYVKRLEYKYMLPCAAHGEETTN